MPMKTDVRTPNRSMEARPKSLMIFSSLPTVRSDRICANEIITTAKMRSRYRMRWRIASRKVLSAMALTLASTVVPRSRRRAGAPGFPDEQVFERLSRRRDRNELRPVAVQDAQEPVQIALRFHPDQQAVVAPRHHAPARQRPVRYAAQRHLPVRHLAGHQLVDPPDRLQRALHEQSDAVADHLGIRQDMGREEDGAAARLEIQDDVADLPPADWIETGHRLVEHDQLRV